MARGARSDGERRREALLDAALGCFAKRGVVATGIEEIRIAAGASPSSVYHLFGGLPGLTTAMLTRTFERLFAHLAVRVLRARTAEGAIRALVGAHLEWVLAHRDEARVMYEAMTLEMASGERKTLAANKAAALAPVLDHLARFVRARALPRWDPLQLEIVVMGPTHEACRRFLGGAAIDAKWMQRELPRLAWRAVAPT